MTKYNIPNAYILVTPSKAASDSENCYDEQIRITHDHIIPKRNHTEPQFHQASQNYFP